MIRLWKPDEPLPALEPGWSAAYFLSRAAAYGTGAQFAPFYSDDCGGLLSLLDGHAIIAGKPADIEEWAVFLRMRTDILSITSDADTAQALADCCHKSPDRRSVMRLRTPPPAPTEPLTDAPPRDLYALLSAVFDTQIPPFESWYVDVSHRLRHGICHTAAIRRGACLTAAAMTVAECAATAVLGGVATLPAFRRQGMAGQCVRGLIAALLAENDRRIILISPKNAAAARLYQTLGFVNDGEIGCIAWEETV